MGIPLAQPRVEMVINHLDTEALFSGLSNFGKCSEARIALDLNHFPMKNEIRTISAYGGLDGDGFISKGYVQQSENACYVCFLSRADIQTEVWANAANADTRTGISFMPFQRQRDCLSLGQAHNMPLGFEGHLSPCFPRHGLRSKCCSGFDYLRWNFTSPGMMQATPSTTAGGRAQRVTFREYSPLKCGAASGALAWLQIKSVLVPILALAGQLFAMIFVRHTCIIPQSTLQANKHPERWDARLDYEDVHCYRRA